MKDGVDAGVEVFLGVHGVPANHHAVAECEGTHERAQCAAVSFAEWMEEVELGVVVSDASNVACPVGDGLKEDVGLEFEKDTVGFLFDKGWLAEFRCAFADGAGADFACPLVNIAKESPVNDAEHVEIERHVRVGMLECEIDNFDGCQISLGGIEVGLGREVEAIHQNSRVRVEIWIFKRDNAHDYSALGAVLEMRSSASSRTVARSMSP